MNTLNVPWISAPQHWHAASLTQALAWQLRRIWAGLERIGQRRAAPHVLELARQMAAEGHEEAADMMQTAQEWARA